MLHPEQPLADYWIWTLQQDILWYHSLYLFKQSEATGRETSVYKLHYIHFMDLHFVKKPRVMWKQTQTREPVCVLQSTSGSAWTKWLTVTHWSCFAYTKACKHRADSINASACWAIIQPANWMFNHKCSVLSAIKLLTMMKSKPNS